MNFTLILGFSCIAGLLVGYFSARLGPRWVFPCLLVVGIVASGAVWVSSSAATQTDALYPAVLLAGVLGSFVFCMFVAGLIGLLALRVATRSEAQ